MMRETYFRLRVDAGNIFRLKDDAVILFRLRVDAGNLVRLRNDAGI
jgi:hypothetical protein